MRYLVGLLVAAMVLFAAPAQAATTYTSSAYCVKDGYRSDVQVSYTYSGTRRNLTAVKVRTYNPTAVTLTLEGIAPNIYVVKSGTRGAWKIHYPNNYYDSDRSITAKFSHAGNYCGYRYL